MCKHVAAVLYGVGARLDESPELLFTLRSVNHEELITQAATAGDLTARTASNGPELAESELGAVFGIEVDTVSDVSKSETERPRAATKQRSHKAPKPARRARTARRAR